MKRVDNKGRVLKVGESQRKDFIYQYRYTDPIGKRQTVYASTLVELRQKEQEIAKLLEQGVNYSGGSITVAELVQQYIATKQNVRDSTRRSYCNVANFLNSDPFGKQVIRNIKVLDAKHFMVRLHASGKSYGWLCAMRSILKPAFDMAVEDDALLKNPFGFKLTSIVSKEQSKRRALTSDEQEKWLDFLADDRTANTYYDLTLFLIETGLRAGEMCGLTQSDIDWSQGVIYVNRQLQFVNGTYRTGEPKSETSRRIVPMTQIAAYCLKSILKKRPKIDIEYTVDGIKGFVLLDKKGRPQAPTRLTHAMRYASDKYNKQHPEAPMPIVTPHVLRHTFCTNMVKSGIDIKTLQYIMGHATIDMTVNKYTHTTQDEVVEQMGRVVALSGHPNPAVEVTTPFTTPFFCKDIKSCVDL